MEILNKPGLMPIISPCDCGEGVLYSELTTFNPGLDTEHEIRCIVCTHCDYCEPEEYDEPDEY